MPEEKAEERVRLGGMALQNGVLVHGPTAWGCAVRTGEGVLRTASGRKRLVASRVRSPLLRGPARLLEALLVIPEARRRLPEARLPFERPPVLTALVGAAVGARVLRRLCLPSVVTELGVGLLGIAPAALALRSGELAAYHGAEHIAIGSYEHGSERPREHERCGSHLVGPLLLASAVASALAARAPERLRLPARAAATLGAVALATELFAWMTQNPGHPLARALARPGHELQRRLATAEPTPAQLEVAEAALTACLELERAS